MSSDLVTGNGPAAYLYGNGNALFFGDDGEQLPELQQHGLSGVHPFREEYPEAPIYWAIWQGEATEIHEDVLEHITEP